MTPREGVEPVAWAIRRDLPISGKGRFIAISNEPYDPSSIDDAEECVVPLYAHPSATAREEAVVTCVYCGHAFPPGSPTHGAQLLKDHIAVCEKHPMRQVIAERDELGTLLAALYRIDTGMTLENLVAAGALAERIEKALVAVDARALALAAKSGGA